MRMKLTVRKKGKKKIYKKEREGKQNGMKFRIRKNERRREIIKKGKE